MIFMKKKIHFYLPFYFNSLQPYRHNLVTKTALKSCALLFHSYRLKAIVSNCGNKELHLLKKCQTIKGLWVDLRPCLMATDLHDSLRQNDQSQYWHAKTTAPLPSTWLSRFTLRRSTSVRRKEASVCQCSAEGETHTREEEYISFPTEVTCI